MLIFSNRICIHLVYWWIIYLFNCYYKFFSFLFPNWMVFWQQFKSSTLAELPQAILRNIIPDLTWVLVPATSLQARPRALEREMASEGSGRGNALSIPLSSARMGAMNTKTSWWCYIHIINNYNSVWIQCLSTHCEVSVHTRAEDGKGELMMLQSEILG